MGESPLFKEGMTIFELFYKHSALSNFCMHSDWVLSYVIEHYLAKSKSANNFNLAAIESYPFCGNHTLKETVIPCTANSVSCRNLSPPEMETLHLQSLGYQPESLQRTFETEGTPSFPITTSEVNRRAQVIVSHILA